MNIQAVNSIDIRTIIQNRKQQARLELKDVDESVRTIVDTVRDQGDNAVYQYIKQLDGVELDSFFVTKEEIELSYQIVDPDLVNIFKNAKENIEQYHQHQKEKSWYVQEPGIYLGQQITPIERVGVYVPGGKAAYPSTVLMNVIPAKVAGVDQIVVTTPAGKDGRVDPVTVVAADISGANQILKVGGAHGIATLAYGTESFKPVYKITGPGNIYVARAKKYVFGDVGIDMIAGPSEVCILATEDAKPDFIAADLLAQAEHDESAQAILVTDSKKLAVMVQEEVHRQLRDLSRKSILEKSIHNHGAIYVVPSLDAGVTLVNELAPEHLELLVDHPFELLNDIKNAGAIFLGHYSPEPLGDYWAGPNHTLPTNGTAKFSSPLGVYDFMKKSSVIYYESDALKDANEQIIKLANTEGLDAHAQSIKKRLNSNGGER